MRPSPEGAEGSPSVTTAAVRDDHSEKDKELLALLSADPSKREYDLNWTQELKSRGKRLRYLTPNELLRLFGFNQPLKSTHDLFVFPEEVSLRKQYELIGNSLSVDVVHHLLSRLLTSSS